MAKLFFDQVMEFLGVDTKEEPQPATPRILNFPSTDYGEDTSGTTPEAFDARKLVDIPEEMWSQMHPMDKAALITSPIPILGTGVGLAADVRSAIQEPDQFFTPQNLALTGLGYVPFGRAAKYGEKLGIFAGTKAAGADLAALDRAKQMQAEGATPEEIWRDTGWFESVDGNWKFEIDDSAATIKDPQMLLGSGEARDLMAHPNLEGQYPDDPMGIDTLFAQPRAGATKTEGGYRPKGTTEGGMDYPEEIQVQPVSVMPSERKSGLLHELQHSVQRREGFARGGNLDTFYDEAIEVKRNAQKVVDDANQKMRESLDARNALNRADPDYQAKFDALTKDYQDAMASKMQVAKVHQATEQELAYQMYRELAGEVEARNVQARMDLTPEQRRATPPWATEDVPISKQQVRGQPKIFEAMSDYRGVHTAPLKEEGVKNTLDDMSDVYGEDVYDPRVSAKYYGHTGAGDPMDQRSADLVAAFQGKPDAEVTIYRAVPKGVKDINSGDWVTLNKNYAKSHGDSWVNGGEYDIISKKVKAKDIVTDGNSIHEFGYDPD